MSDTHLHESRQLCERLPPGAPHPHTQRVAPRLCQHTRNSCDMLQSKLEQHQVQRLLGGCTQEWDRVGWAGRQYVSRHGDLIIPGAV